jgi:L-fuconolactonase
MGVNDAWLGQVAEEPIEPELPICDAHHHLWGRRDHRAARRYLIDNFLEDVKASGHNIVSTVFVDSHAMYRANGPSAMKPVGEVEFANGQAAMAASGEYGSTKVAAAIIGHADMRLGRKAGPVLDAMMRAAPNRFRGIRHCVCFDADETLMRHPDAPKAGLLTDEDFQAGVAEVGTRSFARWRRSPAPAPT